MLSNLQVKNRSGMQILLVGQPELARPDERPAMPSDRQRIA